MRVTLISKAAVVGAYQRKFEAMAETDSSLDLTVVAPTFWRQDGRDQSLERAHTAGYRLLAAPLLFNGQFHAHVYPTLRRILRETRPELLHVDEEPYNLATAHAVWLAQRLSVPALFFAWQNLERRYPPPFRWFERYAYGQVQAAICGNQAAGEVLRAKGYRGALVTIPQFGVDPEQFSPMAGPRVERPMTVGYAGRLVSEKGLLVLAEALADLGGAWRLLLVGSGPERATLERFFGERRLMERITFLNQVPSDAMPAQLQAMDVLVLPSLTRPNWKEQFGRILVEAMACGVPVVGSDSGEIPQVIGEAGLIFAEGDAAALRGQLARLQEDMTLRQTLGQAGRERVLARYTQVRIAQQTLAFYRQVLA